MTNNSFSIMIPLIVLLLAALTKRIFTSLLIGIVCGSMLLANGNPLIGFVFSIEYIIRAISKENSLYVILFLYIFGAFSEIIKGSGGINGFLCLLKNHILTEKGALSVVWFLTPVTFIDGSFHAISTGTIGKSLIDKVNGNRYKLAFVVNTTSCLLITMIPFGTTYIGYIVGVIASSFNKSGITTSPYSAFISSIPFNFYSILMLLFSFILILFKIDIMKENQLELLRKKNKQKDEFSQINETLHRMSKVPPRTFNLLFPLFVLIFSTFFFFWFTGKDHAQGLFEAVIHAQFEKSILLSGTVTILITGIFLLVQKVPIHQIEDHFLLGGSEMVTPIIILVLSWALSSIVQDLGFSNFIIYIINLQIPSIFIPASIFLICCTASYFIGSSWATWALIMPIAVSLSSTSHVNLGLTIGAVLSGGSLGDNTSPLGETALLSSKISGIHLMDHIKTQLPYCLMGVGISAILYILSAMLF